MKNDLRRRLGQYIHFRRIFFAFFFVMLFVMSCATLWPGSDDTFSGPEFLNMGILEWVWWRAQTWQPRMVSDFLIAIFGKKLLPWKLATALVATILVAAIAKLSSGNDLARNDATDRYIRIFVCCSFFLIMPESMSASVRWYTGSFNYLWPALFLVVAITPFYLAVTEEAPEGKSMIPAILCAAFLAYQEQTAAVFVCFGLVTIGMLAWEKRLKRYLVIEYAVGLANICVYLALGGVSIREEAEIMWYHDFPMLSLVDKVFQGVNWTNFKLLNGANGLMFLLACLVFALGCARFKSGMLRTLFFLPAIFIGVGLVPFDFLLSRVAKTTDEAMLSIGSLVRNMLNPSAVGPDSFTSGLMSLLPAVLCLLIMLYTGGTIFFAFADRKRGFLNMLLYYGALASSYVISLSPTIFASGHRVFFVAQILMVLLVGLLVRELGKYWDFSKNKTIKYVSLGLTALAAIFALESFCSNYYGEYIF